MPTINNCQATQNSSENKTWFVTLPCFETSADKAVNKSLNDQQCDSFDITRESNVLVIYNHSYVGREKSSDPKEL